MDLLLACDRGDLLRGPQQHREPLQGDGLIAMLRTAVPCDSGEAAWHMHRPHGAFGLVLVLSAGTSGPERLEAHLPRIEGRRRTATAGSAMTPMNQFLRLCSGRSGLSEIH
jgi:hypothetical protein